MWLTACTIPCSTLMSFFPTATSSVSVAPMYSNAGNHPAPCHRARQRFLRILDLIAHYRGEFQSHQPKANHAKRIQHKTRVSRNLEISSRHRRSKARPHRKSQTNQNRRRHKCSNGAEIIQPLPNSQTNNVHNREQLPATPATPSSRKSYCRRAQRGPAPAQTQLLRRNTASPSAHTACY